MRIDVVSLQQMQNQIFAGGEQPAAIATIRLSHTPDERVLAAVRAIDAVLSVRLQTGA